MGMIRKIKRSIMKNRGTMQKEAPLRTAVKASAEKICTRRAGMHQKAEHEFRRARLAAGFPEPENTEDEPGTQAAPEAEIPPDEEENAQIIEAIAEGEAVIAPEKAISDEISDPLAEVNEENEAETEVREQESLDHSAERIPVLDPVTGGMNCEAREVIYRSGASDPRPIDIMSEEREGIPPFIPEIIAPSANVPAASEG